jgi:hypothetical protein
VGNVPKIVPGTEMGMNHSDRLQPTALHPEGYCQGFTTL